MYTILYSFVCRYYSKFLMKKIKTKYIRDKKKLLFNNLFNLVIIINLIILNALHSAKSSQVYERIDRYHSSGYERQEPHEIVYPRLSESKNRVKRNIVKSDYNEESISLSEKIITIRAENSNTTYYVLIYPNNEFLSSNLSIEGNERERQEDQSSIDSHCLYRGIIVSPIKGKAAITVCGDNNKMYALMITDNNEAFVLRPLDSTYYEEINSNVEQNHKGMDYIREFTKQTLINKHKNQVLTSADQYLSTLMNSNKPEDMLKLTPHVLYRLHQTETEFCDLAFINEKDKKSAFNQFIRSQETFNSFFNTSNNLIRKRRAINKKKIVETAVYIDKYLLNRFNGITSDLTRLVLSIMNEVQLIYSFKSMKTRIKIVITKLVFLKDGDNSPNNANGDIDEYLDNFCSWQSKKWKLENASTRWDHALMLTGLDLYKQSGDKKNKKVLGLAWVNGMCKPTYSCTLNEGKSFEAAFVIAHEMGHSLGILHDGSGNNCDGDKYIMSEKTGPGKVNWSPCSNIYLENFLTKANAKCLDDDSNPGSTELDFQRSNRLPGEQYPPNKQCELALGSKYKAYTSSKEPFNNICRELWCLSGSWATPAHPALEGSSCGERKKCIQGVCSSVSSNVSRRSITNFRISSNRVLQQKASRNVGTRLSPNRTNSRSGFTRSFMDSVKGFLRTATSGAQDFFKLFTG